MNHVLIVITITLIYFHLNLIKIKDFRMQMASSVEIVNLILFFVPSISSTLYIAPQICGQAMLFITSKNKMEHLKKLLQRSQHCQKYYSKACLN